MTRRVPLRRFPLLPASDDAKKEGEREREGRGGKEKREEDGDDEVKNEGVTVTNIRIIPIVTLHNHMNESERIDQRFKVDRESDFGPLLVVSWL